MVRVHYKKRYAVQLLSEAIFEELRKYRGRELVLVCIGTDRSTGDSLGPLVGTFLTNQKPDGVTIYGTLHDPVHATNLQETLNRIEKKHREPLVLAVDSALGHEKYIGYISFERGSIRPGAGVNKRLPEVGDLALSGIVNAGGFMEYFVLQNTRLAQVMDMAVVIGQAIYRAIADMWVEQEAVEDSLAEVAVTL